MGHIIATCVKLKEADHDKIKAGAGQFPDTRRCFYCRVTGHIVHDCERWRRRKEGNGVTAESAKMQGWRR